MLFRHFKKNFKCKFVIRSLIQMVTLSTLNAPEKILTPFKATFFSQERLTVSILFEFFRERNKFTLGLATS